MTAPSDTAPAMELSPQAIDDLVVALQEYDALSRPLFQRRAQRQWALKSLHGRLLEIPRKSVAPMVLALDGANAKAVRTRQLCISEGAWAEEAIRRRPWPDVEQTLGDADGVLPLDGRDLLKQGQEAVGVKRQYCGEAGKGATGQAGVFLGYARRKGYPLVERRLYLPRAWGEDEAYAVRRRRCGVPPDIAFKPTPTLGWELIQTVRQAGPVRGRWVTCEEACGRDTDFLDRVAALGLGSCAAGPHDTPVWRQRPAPAVPAWSGQGCQPTRTRVLAGEAKPAAVAQLAAGLPAACWGRRTAQGGE
jgi:SRSO17 transposase